MQIEYVNSIKKKVQNSPQARILYDADVFENGSGCPNVEPYYRKPCMVFAPHIQFLAHFDKITCPECGKNQSLQPKEWASNPVARYVHDIDTSIYFVSYNYTCRFCGDGKKLSFNHLYENLPGICVYGQKNFLWCV